MSFPDDARVLRLTRQFAAHILSGEIPDDLQPAISNLLGFAKNFYLQFFAEQYGIEVSGFNPDGRNRARRIEASLRHGPEAHDLLLVSHYLTMAEVLDDKAETSDELDPDQEQEEVLSAILELLDRIARWALAHELSELASAARLTHDDFNRATIILAR